MTFGGTSGSTFQNRLDGWQKDLLDDWIDWLIYEDVILDIKDLAKVIDEAILNFDEILESEILNCFGFNEILDSYKENIDNYLKENGGTI